MFARSSTFSGDPTALDGGISYVDGEVMPLLNELSGCVGLSMMVDRESGDCIATTAWHSADAMRDSDARLSPLRDRLGGILGSTPAVAEWEIAAMHRGHVTPQGACCRVTWFRTDHAHMDRGIELYRSSIMPRLEQVDGFCSASLMVNRQTKRACSTVSYDTWRALEESRDEAWAIRDSGAREAGVDVVDAGEYDLVIAHLRVPEMA